MTEDIIDNIADYVPYIGDFYKYGKIAYKISSYLLQNNEQDKVLSQLYYCVKEAWEADTLEESHNRLKEAGNIADAFDGEKKYQLAMYGYLLAKALHLLAICQWAENEDKNNIKETFANAIEACTKVSEIEKTLLTSNRDLIDQIRELTASEKKAIKHTRKLWRKQLRAIDRIKNPWKYRLMWIIPISVVIIALLITALIFI